MGNEISVSSDFYSLSYQKQWEILESCMCHESITWANVLHQVYPAIKDKEFLSNLIENHKNGTNVLSAPASLTQEMFKRHKPMVTPEDLKPTVVPNFATTDIQWQLLTAFMQLPAMNPAPIDAQTTVGAVINNIDGNKFRTAEWAHR